MKSNFKWVWIFLGALAGVWLLASVEGVYYYIKFINKKDSTLVTNRIEKLGIDTNKVIDKLKYWVDELATNDSMIHGNFGFCLATADSGKIILEHNSEQSLQPASSLKIVTTGTALKIAGTGYCFPTSLQYSGTINATTHTLKGNIYIRGSGDPTLGSNNFGGNTYNLMLQRWLTAIHRLGIDSINGAVIGDGEIFDYDAIPGGWAWEDVELDYGTAPSGLSFRENCYDINVSIGTGGVYASVDPLMPGLKTTNTIIYNPAIYNSYAFAAGPPFTGERILRGEVKYSGKYNAPVSDPTYFCAFSLYKYLEKNGIKVSDSATTIRKQRINGINATPERKNILTTYSPSLASIIYYTNHVSQNMYAETMLKLISVIKNSYGSTLGGVNTVYKFWKDKNIDLRGFSICDGSGLSRADNVTAKQLTYFLVSYANDSAIFKTFYNSLPVYGESILINGPKPEPIAALKIHAKGGYMSRVRSLAGYVKNKNGKLLAFTMIVNNHEFVWFTLVHRMEKLLWLMSQLE